MAASECETFAEHLVAFRAGALEAPQAGRLQAHLDAEACSVCRHTLSADEGLDELLGDLRDEQPGVEVDARLVATVDGLTEGLPAGSPIAPPWPWAWIVVLALGVLAALTAELRRAAPAPAEPRDPWQLRAPAAESDLILPTESRGDPRAGSRGAGGVSE
jgi:hypothetical protein